MNKVGTTRRVWLVLLAMLITLPFLTWSMSGFFPNGQPVSAQNQTLKRQGAPQKQTKVIVINYQADGYELPPRTPKIPPELKLQGARLTVHAGDTLRICNPLNVYRKPFSLSAGNKFGKQTDDPSIRDSVTLPPGKCYDLVVKNETGAPITLKMFDEIHTRNKLYLAVLPANYPDQGEEDTPSGPPLVAWEVYQMMEGIMVVPYPVYGRPGDPEPKIKPCNADADVAEAFGQLSGAWKSYRMNVIISGSCEKVTGTFKYASYCEGVDETYNASLGRITGTFTGRMQGTDLALKWHQDAHGNSPAVDGVGSCHINTKDEIDCSGFGCSTAGSKKQ